MELKWELAQIQYSRRPGSNRTFMELKFVKYKLVARNIYVLIAPLWN